MTEQYVLLMARQRSGTGALGTFLDRHPALKYLGEALNVDDFGRKNNFFTYRAERARGAQDHLPCALLPMFESFIASNAAPNTRPIVDVKYNGLHLLNGSWHSVKGAPGTLQHAIDNGIQILHLRRQNYLRVFCSGRLAEMNKVWHATSQEEITHRSLKVDVPSLLAFIDDLSNEDVIIESWLRGYQNILHVDYEDIFDNTGTVRESQAARISEFLGIETFHRLDPAFVKQAPSALDVLVENLDEVHYALARTEYGWMVEAGPRYAFDTATGRVLAANERASKQRRAFRAEQSRAGAARGAIDGAFHNHKNQFPFYGLVDVKCEGIDVTMYTGNDDLVALTYFWYGANAYETSLLSVWLSLAKSARTVLDIGSFTGVYSLLAAAVKPQARVRAVEASRRTCGRAMLNCFLNGLQQRVRVDCLAITDREGMLTLKQFRGENILGIGASVLNKQGLLVLDESEHVQTSTLDSYCGQHDFWPDLIKIAVEGAEVMVLSQAEKVLSNCPPLIVEITPETFDTAVLILKRHGYVVRIIDEALGVLGEDARPSGVMNILAVHPRNSRSQDLTIPGFDAFA